MSVLVGASNEGVHLLAKVSVVKVHLLLLLEQLVHLIVQLQVMLMYVLKKIRKRLWGNLWVKWLWRNLWTNRLLWGNLWWMKELVEMLWLKQVLENLIMHLHVVLNIRMAYEKIRRILLRLGMIVDIIYRVFHFCVFFVVVNRNNMLLLWLGQLVVWMFSLWLLWMCLMLGRVQLMMLGWLMLGYHVMHWWWWCILVCELQMREHRDCKWGKKGSC